MKGDKKMTHQMHRYKTRKNCYPQKPRQIKPQCISLCSAFNSQIYQCNTSPQLAAIAYSRHAVAVVLFKVPPFNGGQIAPPPPTTKSKPTKRGTYNFTNYQILHRRRRAFFSHSSAPWEQASGSVVRIDMIS